MSAESETSADRPLSLKTALNLTKPLECKWYPLGAQLDVEKAVIDRIEFQHKDRGVERCHLEMISHWLDNEPKPSREKLAEAVKNIGGYEGVVRSICSLELPTVANISADVSGDTDLDSGYDSSASILSSDSEPELFKNSSLPPGCGCGECNIHKLCTERCPKPDYSTRLPILTKYTRGETASETASKKLATPAIIGHQYSSDSYIQGTMQLRKDFGSFFTDTCTSLIKKQYRPKIVALYLSSSFSILKEKVKEMVRAADMEELFVILLEVCSWFNFQIIESLIKKFGEDDDEERLTEYKKKFERFAIQRLPQGLSHIQLGPKAAGMTSCKKLVIKVDREWESISVGELERLCQEFAKILNVDRKNLYLADVNEGCIMLTLVVPNEMASILSQRKLTSTQKQMLAHERVVRLSCGKLRWFRQSSIDSELEETKMEMAQKQYQDTFTKCFKSIQVLPDRPLGIGAYGSVYKVQFGVLSPAVKAIYPTLRMSRFMQECKLLSTLRYPNIVQFLGAHQDLSANQEKLPPQVDVTLSKLKRNGSFPCNELFHFCQELIAKSFVNQRSMMELAENENRKLLHKLKLEEAHDKANYGVTKAYHLLIKLLLSKLSMPTFIHHFSSLPILEYGALHTDTTLQVGEIVLEWGKESVVVPQFINYVPMADFQAQIGNKMQPLQFQRAHLFTRCIIWDDQQDFNNSVEKNSIFDQFLAEISKKQLIENQIVLIVQYKSTKEFKFDYQCSFVHDTLTALGMKDIPQVSELMPDYLKHIKTRAQSVPHVYKKLYKYVIENQHHLTQHNMEYLLWQTCFTGFKHTCPWPIVEVSLHHSHLVLELLFQQRIHVEEGGEMSLHHDIVRFGGNDSAQRNILKQDSIASNFSTTSNSQTKDILELPTSVTPENSVSPPLLIIFKCCSPGGTIFNNILMITDNKGYAETFGEESW